MKVFVTGGSGFLGQVLLRRLVAQGCMVRALARSDAAAAVIQATGATPVRGDLASPAELPLHDVDAVVHAAAPVVLWAPWPLYERDIVEASLNLFRRAAQCEVRRFVHVSSEAVLQGGGSLLDVDESRPYAAPPNSDYGRAKKAAEIGLLKAWRGAQQCELVILRPSFIWGEGSPGLQQLLDKVRSGRFAWVDRGRAPFERVHVHNAALAIECALQRPHAGGIYLVTDDQRSTAREFLGAQIEAAGLQVPRRSVPGWLARGAAAALELFWRRMHGMDRQPPLSRFEVAFIGQPRRYRIDATRRELGYLPAVYPLAATAAATAVPRRNDGLPPLTGHPSRR